MTPPSIDVGRLLDDGRWGRYQKWLVFLTALTIIFDGVDNQLLGVSIPSIMRDWNVTRAGFAPVVALGFLGMMIGGATAGVAGDRFGRRVALLGCVALFGVATIVVAAANDVSTLGLLRFIAGIGLGGAMPNAAALTAEYVPARRRPFAVTITIVCVPLGATLAGLLAIPLLPALGWRGFFAWGGAVPLLAAFALAWILPESPRYLARHPHKWETLRRDLRRMGHDVADGAVFVEPAVVTGQRTPLTAIFARGWRGDTFALWAAFVSCLLAVYLGFSWLPTIFAAAGLGPAIASSAVTAWNFGGVFGSISAGVMITRYGSRAPMLAMTAAAIAGAAALSAMTIAPESVIPVIAMLTITGGLINAVQTNMYAVAVHVYPTAMRATGVGAAAAIGRAGAILSGYAGPWALEFSGSASFFILMAAALVVTFGSLATVRRQVPHP